MMKEKELLAEKTQNQFRSSASTSTCTKVAHTVYLVRQVCVLYSYI